jgi:hypothetical protein
MFPKNRAAVLGPTQSIIQRGYNTESPATFRGVSTSNQTDADPTDTNCTKKRLICASEYWFQAFPFWQFHVLLTLFSKFFSSFPHGTCSLSDSRQYLALDGIYHPFWTAFPNYPTLRRRIIQEWALCTTGLSPSMALRSSRLVLRPSQKTLLETTIRTGVKPARF